MGRDTRWGNFWSVAGSWRASNEEFIKDIDWIDDLRVRASYGTSGTLPSGRYDYMATFAYKVYGDEAAGYPNNLANEDLTWEKNINWNIGIDSRLLDRYDLVLEYYNKSTEDLLLDATVPSTTGFSSALRNVGSMENRGVELGLNVDIIRKDNMTLSAGVNWSTYRNRITALSEEGEQIVKRPHIWKAGYSFTQYYTREYAGVDPETGAAQYYKNSLLPDGTLDRTLVGRAAANSTILEGLNADPKGFGGFNALFSWNSLTATMSWIYRYGHHVWDNATDNLHDDGYNSFSNISKKQIERWQNPGDITDVPRRIAGNPNGGYYDSSRAIKKGDFLRLKNFTLSYALPNTVTQKLGLSNGRVYVAGNNLLTFTGLDFDPEIRADGYYNFTFPALRTVTIGIELSL